MNDYSLQLKVIAELKARIAESVSCAIGPTGSGLADVFAEMDNADHIDLLERLAKSDGGRAALVKLGEVAVYAYLGDLLHDMDQGKTQIGFVVGKHGEGNVPSDGFADFWNRS